MNKPNDWWGNSNNAKEWIDQVERHKNDLSYTEQPNIVIGELSKHIDKFNSITEVGSGTGHLIGNIKKSFPDKECIACDINPSLLKWVGDIYPQINNTQLKDITSGFEVVSDSKPDLVFTYQVLQHIAPEDIEKAISELCRIAKKEVWMWEGIGRYDYNHGNKTSKIYNGSFVWHIDTLVDCYEVSVPKNKNVELSRQRLYKVKV